MATEGVAVDPDVEVQIQTNRLGHALSPGDVTVRLIQCDVLERDGLVVTRGLTGDP